MQTYWLVGDDPAQRLARIREEIVGSSLFSSISSESKLYLGYFFFKVNSKWGSYQSDENLLVQSTHVDLGQNLKLFTELKLN